MGCTFCIIELCHPRLVNREIQDKNIFVHTSFHERDQYYLMPGFRKWLFMVSIRGCCRFIDIRDCRFFLGLWVIRKAVIIPDAFSFREGFDHASLKKMMVVNRDLFIRTICLITVFNLFTAKGATFGTETLAANAVLIQIHYLMAYCFDGFANASSLLIGKAVGSRDIHLYKKTLSLSAQWGLYASLILAISYYLFSDKVILLFTNIPGVIELAHEYGLWIVLFPFTAFIGLIFYGVFTGATEAVPIRNSMLLALLAFLFVQFSAVPQHGNHGLWLAFLAFSLGRSLFLALYIPRLNRKVTELMDEESPVKSPSF